MSQSASEFWDFFAKNSNDLLRLESLDITKENKDKLLDEILEHLHEYCDQLFFELGGMPGEKQEFIVTAEGNTEYFNKVEELIANAPVLEDWDFITFIPPRSLIYAMVYEDVELKPQEIWFLPLDNKNKPQSIGFRICLPSYELVKDSKWLKNAVYKMLDTALGEKVFALDIDYIEIKPMPSGVPKDSGHMEMADFAAFVRWKKKKLASL